MLHVETERSFKATKSFLNHASVTMNYDSYVAVTSSFLMKSPIILSLPPQRKAENISTSSRKQSSLRMDITASRALVSYTFLQGSVLPLRVYPCILMMETFPKNRAHADYWNETHFLPAVCFTHVGSFSGTDPRMQLSLD